MKKIPIILIFVGLIVLIIATIVFFKQQQFISMAITTEGQVVELLRTRSGTYFPVVLFTAENGQVIEISSTSSSNPPAYEVGERVEVYYASYNPQGAKISGFFSLWGISAVLGGIGLVFNIVGAVILVMMSDKTKLLAKLKVSGIGVQATIESVHLNQSLQLNGKNPFQVHAKWIDPDSGKEHLFKSINMWFDPSEQLIDSYITVFIEPNNPKRYAMDISFLQKTV
ncbi:DUF3592 domain-containing protein [uncultured Neptuniibacter sp.]|uniref:DUF3592 domain-containing protein n=1 Tax=uncultured Neptuniibacter sp. TaxID=502143 RepID=UPI0032B17F92